MKILSSIILSFIAFNVGMAWQKNRDHINRSDCLREIYYQNHNIAKIFNVPTDKVSFTQIRMYLAYELQKCMENK